MWPSDYCPACEPELLGVKFSRVAAVKRNAVAVLSSLPPDTVSLSWLPPESTTSIDWPLGAQLPVLRPFDVCNRNTDIYILFFISRDGQSIIVFEINHRAV